MRNIWTYVLQWLQIRHTLLDWNEELDWLMTHYKGKGWRSKVLKCAIAETVYEPQNFRNQHCLSNNTGANTIGPRIIGAGLDQT